MKKNAIRYALLLLAAIFVTACDPRVEPNPEQELTNDRTVIYTVNDAESRASLHTDAEWDAMLDRFCALAREGSQVVFYSMATAPQPSSKGSTLGGDEKPETISTTSRDEIKEWMKTMERKGKTVTVTYHEPTGTWTGVANATAPQSQQRSDCYTGQMVLAQHPEHNEFNLVIALSVSDDSLLFLLYDGDYISDSEVMFFDVDMATVCGTIGTRTNVQGESFLTLDLSAEAEYAFLGSWVCTDAYTTRVEYTISPIGIAATTYIEQSDVDNSIYTFEDDGTLRVVSDGAQQTFEWSVSEMGEICSPGIGSDGGCWLICWLTTETLVLTRADEDADGNELFYTMQFSATH